MVTDASVLAIVILNLRDCFCRIVFLIVVDRLRDTAVLTYRYGNGRICCASAQYAQHQG